MSPVLLLLAAWLYAGRALLLPLAFGRGGADSPAAGPVWFCAGLLLPPLLLALTALLAPALTYSLLPWLLALIDLGLIAVVVWRRHQVNPRALIGGAWIGLFAASCALLAWFSGPLVEQLSDAWWHMGNVATMRDQGDPGLPLRARSAGLFSGGALAWLGVDFSNYRMQVVLAGLVDSSILEAWYASTVVIAGLLGASFLLLARGVLDDARAVAVALVCWLVVLGGMNTAFRISGWPGGMGYVFLNLGLAASWILWQGDRRFPALALLGLSMAGMALFHLAELYLLAVALGALVATALLLRQARGGFALWFPLLMLAGIGVLWLAGQHVGRPPSRSALVPGAIVVLAAWWIALLARRPWNPRVLAGIGVAALLIAGLGIHWPHAAELFTVHLGKDPGYYNAYIPKYLVGLGEKLVVIPKWEHQLRAALLWSGLLAPLLALWLALRTPGPRTTWLLALCVAPWLLLLSPPLFSLAVSPIPVYGGYRVQFLIPVALVLGLAFSTSLRNVPAPVSTTLNGPGLRILVAAACLLSVTPDFLVRVGAWAERPWAVYPNANFHWRLGDGRPAIRDHTSWRYLGDLAAIRRWSKDRPPAAFLSDLATAYYVAAETTLHPAIRHAHHSNRSGAMKELYDAFCAGEADAAELASGIRRFNGNRARDHFQSVRYVVVNRDTRNFTAEVNGGACVGETEQLRAGLARIAEPVLEGEYLTVWALRDSVQDDAGERH